MPLPSGWGRGRGHCMTSDPGLPTLQGRSGVEAEPPGAASFAESAKATDDPRHPGSAEDLHPHGHGDRYQQGLG